MPPTPREMGDKLQDNTHSTCWCRTNIPLTPQLRIPAQGPRWQRTLPEGGEFGALSYTWSLPLFLPILRHKRKSHWSRPQLASTDPHCLHPAETDTREDTASTQTEVVRQQMMHTDTNPSAKVTVLALPVLFWAVLFNAKTQHASNTLRHLLMPFR